MENNIKIRSIEIEAFRGYAKRVLFDFTMPGGKIADIIAIYAPNGFGKTSFFDAVEWAIKGSVERFREDTLMMQTAQREKGNILKNSESSLDTGRVKIIDEENKYYERFTTIKSDQWDLLKGETNNNSTSKIKINQEQFEESRRVEILPQSRVDAFIASKKPSERYEALVDFWGGKDDSKYYKAINDLLKFNDKIIIQKEEEIKKVREEIIALIMPLEQALVLEELTTYIKERRLFELNSLFYRDINALTDLDQLVQVVNNKIVQVEGERYRLFDNKNKLAELVNNYPVYIEKINNRNSISLRIKEIQQLLNISQERILLNETINLLLDRNKLLENDLKEYSYIIENFDFLIGIDQKINKAHDSNNSINIDNQNLGNKLSGLEYDKGVTAKQLSESLVKRWEIDEKRQDLVSINEEYNVLTVKKRHVDERLLLAKNILTIRAENRKKVEDEIASKNKVLSLDDNNTLYGFLKDNVEMNDIQQQLSFFEKLLVDQNSSYLKAKTLQTDLQKLASLGFEIVRVTKADNCPLCSATYDNFQSLLDNIELSNKQVLDTDNISSRINNTQIQIDLLIEKKQYFISSYKDSLLGEIERDERILVELEKKYSKSLNLVSHISLEQLVIEGSIRRLETRMSAYSTIFSELENVIDSLRIGISEIDDSIEAAKATIVSIEKSLEEINRALSDNNNKILLLSTELYNYSNDKKYIEISKIMQNKGLLLSDIELNDINGRVETIQKLLVNCNEQIAEIRAQSETYSEKLITNDASNLRQSLQSFEYEISKIGEDISSFNFALKSIAGKSVFDKNEIDIKLTELDRNLIALESDLDALRTYKENSDYLRRNIEINSKKNIIQKYEDELVKARIVNEKFILIHGKLSSFLKDKINSVFNHEIINDIYQKIDPHPIFKKISLEPIFLDKPELLIKVVDNDSEVEVDPILYLSSAQVSILSLSIFFAKAIQNSTPLVNTIFMDDPIQYMDSINVLSFIDLIRSITSNSEVNRQIVLSTHDENFFGLLKRKFDSKFYNSKFIEFESYGTLKQL